MGSFSIWHWFVVLIFWVAFMWPLWKITRKMGYHPAFSLLYLVPGVNVLAIWYVALAEWPRQR